MAPARSIPPAVVPHVLRRWIAGSSIPEIEDWLLRTNRRRKTPVHASRRTIERLLQRVARGDRKLQELAIVGRIRSLASRAQDKLEDIDALYLECLEHPPTTREEKRALDLRLTALQTAARGAFRILRLAGIEHADPPDGEPVGDFLPTNPKTPPHRIAFPLQNKADPCEQPTGLSDSAGRAGAP